MNLPDEASKLKADAVRVIDSAKTTEQDLLSAFEAHRPACLAILIAVFLLGGSLGLALH